MNIVGEERPIRPSRSGTINADAIRSAFRVRMLQSNIKGKVWKVPRILSVSSPDPPTTFVFSYGADHRLHVGMRINMPRVEEGEEEDASLLWIPTPPHITLPCHEEGNPYYHKIRMGMVQPRSTRCYGKSYAYSGTSHPMEPETPKEIEALFAETNAMFGLEPGKDGVNMCLENQYLCGYHSISAHADDERSMGQNNDVYCWVGGNASRVGVFRRKSNPKEIGCKIDLPNGLYVMQGRAFQRHFTHEFPKVHTTFFNWMRSECTKLFSTYNGYPASASALEQAEWIRTHLDLIQSKVRFTSRQSSALKQWCKVRVSYTLRSFTEKVEEKEEEEERETKRRKNEGAGSQ